MSPLPSHDVYPPKADLRKEVFQPLPVVPPGTVDAASLSDDEATKIAVAALGAFKAAVETNDAVKLVGCFHSGHTFWRDMVALTAHLRTFKGRDQIAAAFLETKQQRRISGEFKIEGSAHLVSATPTLQFINSHFTFRTSSPAAECKGRLLLLPTKTQTKDGRSEVAWKIWILHTRIGNLDVQAEDETLLKSPRRVLPNSDKITTDVLIIGGGNSGITLAARLKALRVDYIVVDQNPSVGDNWAFRYDCLRFHLPTAVSEMPYLRYSKELQTPHLLTREDLAGHLKRYAAAFDLNIAHSVKVKATSYDETQKEWTVRISTAEGDKTIVCKQLVQATGICSAKPNVPQISDSQLYKGISLHSTSYKNPKLLIEKGVKSVLVVGSANTAFDVLEDCYKAGLKTAVNARSPTYIFPVEYTFNAHGLGLYDTLPTEVVDTMFCTMPAAVDGQLVRGLFGHLASMEPDRYKALAEAGFPVYDSRHPDASLQHHLNERGGGHFVDVGEGISLISEGKVTVYGSVEPVAYTETGVRFSDGTTVDADAIVWCTGFADDDVRTTAAEIMGNNSSFTENLTNNTQSSSKVLGPQEVAARLDATWGVDAEGEIRGMWKRHLRMENYWVMGGNVQHQRWWSRILAQQIKMALEGILPPAYRETPVAAK